jgi:transcriptional regulator GlxA family with amidase domain
MTTTRRIGIIAYPDVQGLDIVGPADAFAAARLAEARETRPLYEVVLIGLSSKPVVSESGIVFQPKYSIHNSPQLDSLLIPGGRSLRTQPTIQARVAAWVQRQAKQTRRIAAVCTGAYAIAPTGLLDGRKVTTHWRFAEDLAARFPKLKVQANSLYVKDGAFYSSAGITAGIDLSLALIEEDFGPHVALGVARDLVVYLKRSGGQEQYSAPLQFQSQAQDRLADVAAWIANNLTEDLSVEHLAQKANVCPRHFTRLFRQSFGGSPADFVEKLRLGEARRLLGERASRVEQVAEAVGFGSTDAFRRAFERRLGLSPSQYRGRFQPNGRSREAHRSKSNKATDRPLFKSIKTH